MIIYPEIYVDYNFRGNVTEVLKKMGLGIGVKKKLFILPVEVRALRGKYLTVGTH